MSTVYEPIIVLAGQGKKYLYLDNKRYEYGGNSFFASFLPMPFETEIIEASPDKPVLCAGIRVNLARLTDIMSRIERADGTAAKHAASNPSGIFSAPLNDNLIDAFIRLLESLANPLDAAILGEMIVDEIYYHVLCSEQGGDLRFALRKNGKIQRISRALEHIHHNIHEPVSVERLAKMVHMSRTGFYKYFKELMHLSPLQYAKSIKLFKAQTLIKDGNSASEAGYLVGYNSPAQFSREYKRHFGFAPSDTLKN